MGHVTQPLDFGKVEDGRVEREVEGGGRPLDDPLIGGKRSDLKKDEGGGKGRGVRGRREELVWMSGMVARGMIRQSSLTRLGLMINTAVTGVVTTTANNRKGRSRPHPPVVTPHLLLTIRYLLVIYFFYLLSIVLPVTCCDATR